MPAVSYPPRPTCLVTGCAGFVGSHLTEALLQAGCSVIGVDNFFSGRAENMAPFAEHPNFRFYQASIAEPHLFSLLQRSHGIPDLVFHLAAIVSVPYSLEHPEETMDINCHAALALYEQSRRTGAKAFVFAGSAAEYGEERRLPIKEEYAGPHTIQLSPYGKAKYLASSSIAAARYGTSLRFFNIYGPRQAPDSPYSGVISRFVAQALSDDPLTIHGDGSQTRDFLHVSDAVRAYCIAARLDSGISSPLQGVYNIGTGQSLSIRELAAAVAVATGKQQDFCFLPPRQGDIHHSVAAVGKMLQDSGFKATTPLSEGLQNTVEWAKKKRFWQKKSHINA